MQRDPEFRDYYDLLLSDHDDGSTATMEEAAERKETTEHRDVNGRKVAVCGDLDDDFMFQALGVEEAEFKRTQIGSFEAAGARFAKWSEMEKHRDKFRAHSAGNGLNGESSTSLYDQTISHLLRIQKAKERGGAALSSFLLLSPRFVDFVEKRFFISE